MPYSRRRPRIAPGGRVTVRLNPEQRDIFLHSVHTPKNLGHILRQASVRKDKIEVRVTREAVNQLISVAAKVQVAGRQAERALDTFLRYLENLADRFAESETEGD